MKHYNLIKLLKNEICNEAVSKLQTSTEWSDGKFTTGDLLKDKKHNKELNMCDLYKELADMVMREVSQNQDIQDMILIKQFVTMLISKTGIDGGYGSHYDSPFFPSLFSNELQRCDYSFTIFLNDNFEGGNLIIEDQTVKPKQGYMCIYPSQKYHQVTKVLSNERYVICGWLQSLISDPQIREAIKIIETVKKDLLSKNKNDYYTEYYQPLEKATQLIWTKYL